MISKMEYTSTTPYLIRAIHEWCVDNNLTPHLLVAIMSGVQVPMGYSKNGEIVLNLSYGATKGLLIENEAISFSARFAGVSHDIYVPMQAVKGIFSRENGQGMFFEVVEPQVSTENQKESILEVVEKSSENKESKPDGMKKSKKPTLKIVK
jgi:stringent starvation protein B